MIGFEHVFMAWNGYTVLRDLSLTFPEGQMTMMTGPSGCGKTTCLRLLAGLLQPTGGLVHRDVKNLSYLFQDATLLPWLNARDNVNLVLSDRKETFPQAMDWLGKVGLGLKGEQYPAELSGGMQQRVALARALCTGADLLLLDEPMRGLDPDLRTEMMALIRRERRGKTTILVTHSLEDLSPDDYHVVLN